MSENEEGLNGASESVLASLLDALPSQETGRIQEAVEQVKALSHEDALPLCHEERLLEAVQFHWRWDHAGEEHDPVCAWLGAWYQIDSQLFKNFVLANLPDMLWNLLSKGRCHPPLSGIESLLVLIYNYSTFDEAGKDRVFHVPSPLLSSSLHVPAKELDSGPESVGRPETELSSET